MFLGSGEGESQKGSSLRHLLGQVMSATTHHHFRSMSYRPGERRTWEREGLRSDVMAALFSHCSKFQFPMETKGAQHDLDLERWW